MLLLQLYNFYSKLIREVSSIQYVSLRYAIMENVASMIIRLTRWVYFNFESGENQEKA